MFSEEDPTGRDGSNLIDELDRYLLGLYPGAESHLASKSDLKRDNATFLVARIDGEPVGCGALLIKKGYAELKRIFVKPGYRKTGLGKQIVDMLCKISLTKGITTIRLETGIFQQDAVRLYRRSGFREIDAFGEYQENGLSLYFEKEMRGVGFEPTNP